MILMCFATYNVFLMHGLCVQNLPILCHNLGDHSGCVHLERHERAVRVQRPRGDHAQGQTSPGRSGAQRAS